MRKLLSLFIFCSFLIIIVFLLFGDFEQWTAHHLNTSKSLAAYTGLSFALLTGDIILPVPSSLVMILNGKVLGVFFGSLLSLVSGVLSSSIGFFLGKFSNPFLEKIFSEKERNAGNSLFKRFGYSAIIISKSLPVISEAVSFVSGTTSVAFKTFFIYSFMGHLLVSVIYAYMGSFAGAVDSNILSAIIIAIALVLGWITQRRISSKTESADETFRQEGAA